MAPLGTAQPVQEPLSCTVCSKYGASMAEKVTGHQIARMARLATEHLVYFGCSASR